MAKRKSDDNISFTDVETEKKLKIGHDDGQIEMFFGADGESYSTESDQGVVYVYPNDDEETVEAGEQVVEVQDLNPTGMKIFKVKVEKPHSAEVEPEQSLEHVVCDTSEFQGMYGAFPEPDCADREIESAVDSVIVKTECDPEEFHACTEIKLHMDIFNPLHSIRESLVEGGIIDSSCTNVEYWLQDTNPLDPNQGLDQICVQQNGEVQVILDVKTRLDNLKARVSIGDVLVPCNSVKPSAAVVPEPTVIPKRPKVQTRRQPKFRVVQPKQPEVFQIGDSGPEEFESFVVAPDFQMIQERNGFKEKPLASWTSDEVKIWLNWAQMYFPLQAGIDELDIRGQDIADTDDGEWGQWVQDVPHQREHFSMHMRLLKTMNCAALHSSVLVDSETPLDYSRGTAGRGNRSGNNGQIQLWQFLLDILLDRNYQEIIEWVGTDGTFRLRAPNEVARHWGLKKNKQSMTYDKMSRAMRYYYAGDMIQKAPGNRFTYKFVCDLRQYVGFTVMELQRLVNSPTAAIECGDEVNSDRRTLEEIRCKLQTPGCIRRGEINRNQEIKQEEINSHQVYYYGVDGAQTLVLGDS